MQMAIYDILFQYVNYINNYKKIRATNAGSNIESIYIEGTVF